MSDSVVGEKLVADYNTYRMRLSLWEMTRCSEFLKELQQQPANFKRERWLHQLEQDYAAAQSTAIGFAAKRYVSPHFRPRT